MPTPTLTKLHAVLDEIDRTGNADPLRLTVLKKWFEHPGRLLAFALWVAARAAAREGAAEGAADALLADARALLAASGSADGGPDPPAAVALHGRLRAFQRTYQRQKWGAVRVIRDMALMLVEEALATYLWHGASPSHGYRLAVTYCAHYDPRFGQGLNGPSRAKLEELIGFVQGLEARERQGYLAARSPVA
jgi:hypothetical protein